MRCSEFQPTRSRRARPDARGDTTNARFQPTRSRRARQSSTRDRRLLGVSTHALAKSATLSASSHTVSVSTHALAKSATGAVTIHAARNVSTHALAKSATCTKWRRHLDRQFQPTRSRRARPRSSMRPHAPEAASFNPRAREERDRMRIRGLPSAMFQPTRSRRARRERSCGPRRSNCFNPRAREERDRARASWHALMGVFQPTRSRRARPRADCRAKASSFNPRAREERDQCRLSAVSHAVSTHALAKSATHDRVDDRRAVSDVSTHALAKSATPGCWIRCVARMFQPTRSRRARPRDQAMLVGTEGGFNPRAREERDLSEGRLDDRREFQPTRSRRARPAP